MREEFKQSLALLIERRGLFAFFYSREFFVFFPRIFSILPALRVSIGVPISRLPPAAQIFTAWSLFPP
jgi:hypothetical protein